MINLERRKRVMQRSIKLGHCICDPRKPCPCDLFKQQDICQCAGERLESPTDPVKLTRLVEKAGCASKIDQLFLKQVLRDLPAFDDPRVLVGVPAGDDAGIYDLGNGRALVQTVDVFTPAVDDPYLFGQVAAANSVSDIYAMGGAPLSALSILGFPVRKIPDSVMSDILRGGIDKMKEAGVAIIGGHSINDDQIKAGFAVTGIIDKDKIVTNAGARPGDALILTKPLGTGITAFADQIGRAHPDGVRAAAESMTALNRIAAEQMVAFGAHAATDVTGFSLVGHLAEMALSSGVDVEITFDDLPLFPGVPAAAAAGIIPGAVERNKESCIDRIIPGPGVAQEMIDICFDAQTSGGLLISIAPDRAEALLTALHDRGVTAAAVVGKVLAPGTGKVHLQTKGTITMSAPEENIIPQNLNPIPDAGGACCGEPQECGSSCTDDQMPKSEPKPESCGCETTPAPKPEPGCEPAPTDTACCGDTTAADPSCCSETAPVVQEESCCADAAPAAGPADGVAAIQQQFHSFLGKANAPGALDAYTKQALALALSVLAKCEPCVKIHIKKAQAKGFTQEEIDEAAWMAIAFGGSPTMMFYNEIKKSLNL